MKISTSRLYKIVEELIDKAGDAGNADDALKFAQAAANIQNTIDQMINNK